MSEPAKCPKCGTVSISINGRWVQFGCGSEEFEGQLLERTDACRIRELEAENKALRESIATMMVKWAREVTELERLRESDQKRDNWLREARERAGHSRISNISFDVVFDELLSDRGELVKCRKAKDNANQRAGRLQQEIDRLKKAAPSDMR